MNPHQLNARAALALVTRTTDALGCTLPAKLSAELDRIDAYVSATSRLVGEATSANVTVAAADIIVAGRDPLTDPAVRELMLNSIIATPGLSYRVDKLAEDDRLSLIAEYADPVIELWSKALRPHAKALHTAAERFRYPDLANAAAVVGAPAGKVQVWADATAARTAWASAAVGWGALITLRTAASGTAAQRQHILAMTNITEDQLLDLEREHERPDAWAVASAGHPLELVNLKTYNLRVKAWSRTRTARKEAATKERNARGFN